MTFALPGRRMIVPDILSSRLLWLKAFLFLALAGVAASLVLAQHPHLSTLGLLLILVWASARAYYFAFYVIERYADPSFRYSGIASLVAYIARRHLKWFSTRS